MTWGDFNGDGFGDLAYGDMLSCTPYLSGGTKFCQYRIRVHPGGPNGLSESPLQIAESGWNTVRLPDTGFFKDVVVLPLAAADFDRDGRAQLVYVGTDYVSYRPRICVAPNGYLLNTSYQDCNFPYGPVAAGDLTGDGYPDLAIGAPNETVSGAAEAGQVRIYFGSATGMTSGGAL
jgi:hypothetical protein